VLLVYYYFVVILQLSIFVYQNCLGDRGLCVCYNSLRLPPIVNRVLIISRIIVLCLFIVLHEFALSLYSGCRHVSAVLFLKTCTFHGNAHRFCLNYIWRFCASLDLIQVEIIFALDNCTPIEHFSVLGATHLCDILYVFWISDLRICHSLTLWPQQTWNRNTFTFVSMFFVSLGPIASMTLAQRWCLVISVVFNISSEFFLRLYVALHNLGAGTDC